MKRHVFYGAHFPLKPEILGAVAPCAGDGQCGSDPRLANDTGDITSVTFRNHRYRAVLQNNRTPMKAR